MMLVSITVSGAQFYPENARILPKTTQLPAPFAFPDVAKYLYRKNQP
jgi:hypothetical protein